jgi:putative ABC transport system permease protein
MARASYNAIVDWMEISLNPDLFVLQAQNILLRTIRFPKTMGPELAAIQGVERIQMERDARVVFRDTPIMVVAIEIESLAQTDAREPVAGDREDMYRRTAAGEGLIVSDNLAQLQHLSLGEVLEVPAPAGLIRLPIVGIVISYNDQQGSILMDRTLFERYWHDDSVNVFRVYLKPGVAAPDVRQRILELYAGTRQVFVLTNGELKQYILKVTDQWFGLTSVQIAVAVLVAILGIVNTLTVSITDRRRELGVLRAIGGLRGQIRRTIWIEALSIGCLGLTLGFALGAINLYYILQIVHRDIGGLRLAYAFPTNVGLALVPTILAAASVAAIWPAESAVRGPLVEALEYE